MKTQFGRFTIAIASTALLAACVDSTAPSRTLVPTEVARAVTLSTFTYPTPGLPVPEGVVRLCKTANAAGSFDFSVSVNSAQATTTTITLAAAGTQCSDVFTSAKSNGVAPDQVVITEAANQTNWQLTAINTEQLLAQGIYNAGGYPAPRLSDAEDFANRKVTLYINKDMARRTTFTNTYTPPQNQGCTYTKGWYQNKNGAPTVTAVDGRTKLEAQTILASTPSPNPAKNLGVTWGTDNLLHNLYQQLLTALLNGGAGGPAAVQAAITAAQNGTGGTGLNITTTLTHDQMAALVETLTDFNEGNYQGWPHCAD